MNIEEAQLEWATCSNFPIAFSTIDCSHIASVNPANYGDGYVNRKNVHSVNVHVTCSSNECFKSNDRQYPGHAHHCLINDIRI